MCGGFTCSKNALTALNILYIVSRHPADSIPSRGDLSPSLSLSSLSEGGSYQSTLPSLAPVGCQPSRVLAISLRPDGEFTGASVRCIIEYASRFCDFRILIDRGKAPPRSPLSFRLSRVFFLRLRHVERERETRLNLVSAH